MPAATFADRYDAVISGPDMQRVYGGSGYFNVGYWVDGVGDLPAACDRMVDEIADAVPRDARSIIDVGCGVGAGTRRLARRFPAARVAGVNLSLWQLGQTRGRGVEDTVASDAACMGIRGGSVDAVVSIEAAQHFDTRAEFLAEARRVLRPGGVLTIADMLFRDAGAIGPWMLPAANVVATPADYAGLLAGAGFVDASVRDVTAVSWKPFCGVMRRGFEGSPQTMQAIEDSLGFYVLAVARTPA